MHYETSARGPTQVKPDGHESDVETLLSPSRSWLELALQRLVQTPAMRFWPDFR